MVFSSLIFLFVFLPIVLLMYYISNKKLKNLILLMASLVFYAWGEPVYVVIMIFSIVFNYINGLIMDRYHSNGAVKSLLLIVSIVVNLGILCYFKYYGFFVENINNFLGLKLSYRELPLPVGISFYTFQTMSYVIDVYRGNINVQKDIISFGTYVTMFPQLVAGPIVKYGEIEKQLENRVENLEKFSKGIERFIIGLAKKVLLANNIGILWTTVKTTPIAEISALSAWLGIIAFTFQIYFDFSGYSDMAIGLGKMFGFQFVENFDYPYISRSITEFWRRWHISLGSWFREYVYIPLGGNRCGWLKQYRNLFIVWLLTGFWHGANWNFILWGLYFGFILIIEKTFLKGWLDCRPKVIGHIYTMLVVIVGWVFFEFESVDNIVIFIKTMFGFGENALVDGTALYYLRTYFISFIILIICSTPFPKNIVCNIGKKYTAVEPIVLPVLYFILIFLSTAYLVDASYNPFLYFRF